MQALDLLLNRSSYNKLICPAPEGEQLTHILKAGMRAPDHGNLSPWQFIAFKDKGLDDLGEIYAEAAEQDELPAEKVEKAKNMPSRAPLVIAVIAKVQTEHKIPEIEQVIAAGCCVQAMQMAAVAQGFQGIWRTGAYAYHPHVKKQFKLAEQDVIVGYLYLGTAEGEAPVKPEKDLSLHLQYW